MFRPYNGNKHAHSDKIRKPNDLNCIGKIYFVIQNKTYFFIYFTVTCVKQLWLLENNLCITFSLLVIHVYIETLLLFDENLLKITKIYLKQMICMGHKQ